MASQAAPMTASGDAARESRVPMIAIALGQAIMSFNVASLPVALSGMVASFGVPPTTVATGIVMYSLAVAGFVMLGAKLVQRFGATSVFRVVVALFAVAQVLMTVSPVASVMLTAQLLAGLAASVIVPALVALIAHHYDGQQQATAIGALGSARAGAGVLAFLIGGMLGTFIGWRPVFGILVVVSAIVFVLSFKLKPAAGRPEVRLDPLGVVLAATAIILISFGFNNLNRWGLGVARPGAPFDLLGLSPAPVMIVLGIALLQVFVRWCRQQQQAGRTPLLDLRVIASSRERAAVIAMFAVVGLEAMLNFSVPLYIQIIQGRTPLETAVAMLPFNLTVFFTAILVVRLYRTLTPRRIGQLGFIICTVALVYLAWVVRNDWSAVPVMFGLIAFGIGQGALVTLVFNVLVTAAPKELAGDVGSLRGTTQNLAAGVGTALAGVAAIETRSPARLPSPSLTPVHLVDVARAIEDAFAAGTDGAVVVQGTDTIEESAFLLDVLIAGEKPVVVTGAMRGADAPGADGPANLLAAVRVAAAPEARGLGTLVVLNYDIHAARFVQKSHTALPSAFASPLTGVIGRVAEGQPRLYTRLARNPALAAADGPAAPVALLKIAMGDDGRLVEAVADLGFAGAVIEGMGAGHVHADVASKVGALAARLPVVLASRAMTGPVFTRTYGYPGGEIDLIARGVIPAGYLSGLKARLLLGLALRHGGGTDAARVAFAPYQ